MKKILFTLTLLISLGGYAQQKEIRGTILSINGDPVSGVKIFPVSDWDNTVVSDANGNYKITIQTAVDIKICYSYESTEKKRFFRKLILL